MDLAPVFTPVQHLGDYIREQRTAAQISLRALAAKAGVSNPYLSQVERGLRRPSAGVLAQIANGLSISTETLLVKAGILTQSGAGPVVEAIRADPRLTDHHKSVLIEVYAAFRRESGDDVPPDRDPPGGTPAIRVGRLPDVVVAATTVESVPPDETHGGETHDGPHARGSHGAESATTGSRAAPGVVSHPAPPRTSRTRPSVAIAAE